jgi:hypothetical protein
MHEEHQQFARSTSSNPVPVPPLCFTAQDRLDLSTWAARNERYRRYAYPIDQTDEGQDHVGLTAGNPGNPTRWHIVKAANGYILTALGDWPSIAIRDIGPFPTMGSALEAILPMRQAA